MTDMPLTSFSDYDDEEEMPIESFSQMQEMPITSFRQVEKDEKQEQEGLTRNQILSNPEQMAAIRKYMVQRKGVGWENREDEELMDSYMGHMRFVNANDLRTVSEALYIQRATPEQKAAAADAYSVYDEMAPFWESGEGAGALYDYGRAILFSPSTYIGGIIGKFGMGALGKLATREAVMMAAKTAAESGGAEAGRAVISAAIRSDAIKVGLGAATVDAGLSFGQDWMLQNEVMMDSGAQDEYSVLEGATSLLGGAVGGLAAIPELTRGSLGIIPESIAESKALRKSRATGLAVPRIKAAVDNLAEKLNQPVLGSGSIDWKAAVARGEASNPNLNSLTENMGWFFDVENPDSLVRIIVDSGADLERKEGQSFTESVLGFMNDIPEDQLKDINDVLEPATGIKLGQLIDMVAVGQSKAGSMHNVASQASKYAQDFAHLSKATEQANKSVVNDLLSEKPPAPESPEYARYLASLWRRMIVSHPATTAVNVQGWGIAHAARSMAEMVNGGLLGTAGMVGKTLGRDWGDTALRNAKNSWANQIFKAKTLLDPYESKEVFDALLANAPKRVQDRMTMESFGGVYGRSAPEIFGIKPNMAIRSAEKISDFASKASFIHIQDTWTKTFSGLGELDNQVRKAYNKSLSQLVTDGEYYKITDDMWNNSMRTLLEDTFSMDYTKGKGALNKAADIVERMSNAPYIGFLFPFGRFMNNNMAFTLQYSPLAFMPLVGRMKKAGIKGFVENTDDIGTDLSKVVVGTTALATLMNYSRDGIEKGYQWWESEDSEGNLTSKETLAPVSQFMLMGRIIDRAWNGESVNMELLKDFTESMGWQQWSRELSDQNPLKPIAEMLTSDKVPDEEKQSYMELLGAAAEAMSSQFLSGFTRPLDPINKFVGMATDTDQIIDRRQADPGWEKAKLEVLRYTDNIFGLLTGDDVGVPLRSASRPEGDVYQPNDVATLVGRKEVLPKNYTDKLLGMVDMPAYLLDQRTGNAQADRFMNEMVGPILNERSRWLMKDEYFNKAPLGVKTQMVKTMLTNVRKDVRTMLTEGLIGNADNRLDDQRRAWLVYPQDLRTQAKKDLGITTKDKDLSEQEINMLKNYMGTMRKFLQGRTQ